MRRITPVIGGLAALLFLVPRATRHDVPDDVSFCVEVENARVCEERSGEEFRVLVRRYNQEITYLARPAQGMPYLCAIPDGDCSVVGLYPSPPDLPAATCVGPPTPEWEGPTESVGVVCRH